MTVWIFLDLILVILNRGEVMPYVLMKSFIWISLGILFLNFIYNLLSIKKDLIYQIIGYSVLICEIINIFTDWIYLNGPLFLPVTLLIVMTPILYSFALIYKEITRIESGILFQKQLTLMLYGSISLLVVGVLFGIILPYAFNEESFFYITSSITGLQALFMLPALIKYNFLNVPIEQVTAELFKTSKNAEIVTDSFQAILQANNTALELFDTDLSELKKKKVSDLFHNYDFSKNYKNHETKTTNDRQREVSISQSNIIQSHFNIGKIIIIQDISSKKENERKLLESEERYRTLVEHSPNAILIHDSKQILFVNQAAVKIGEFNSKDDLIGQPPFSFLHPDSLEIVMERTKKLLAGKNPGTAEIKVKSPTDDVLYAEVNSAIVQYRGKQVIQSTLHNITERKEAEDALRESEEKFSLAVRGTNDGIWDWDILTGQTYFAPKWKEMIGYDDNEIENTYEAWESLIHPDDKDHVLKTLQTYLDRKIDLYEPEFRMKHKDGSWVWIQARGQAMRDKDEKPYRMSGAHTNITERKATEKALQESEERYRELVEKASDIIYRTDASTGKYTYVNPMFMNISGYTEEELLEMHYADIVHPDYKEETLKFYKIQFTEKRSITYYELPIITKIGEQRWVGQNVQNILNDNGKADYFSVIARDITERKQIEDALKESETSLQQAQRVANFGSWTENHVTKEIKWSDECKLMFGFNTNEDIDGEKFWSKVHPDDAKWLKKVWHKAEKEMEPYQGSFRILFDNNTVKYCSEKAEFISDNAGKLLKTIGTVHDITEQHKADEEISRYHEQLRNLSARLQRLQEDERKSIAREIHDEFGQSLTGMKMELSWIRKKMTSDDSEIHERLHSMNDLIDDSIYSVQSLSTQLRPSLLDELGLSAAVEWQLKEFENRTQVECILDLENENIVIDPDRSIAIFRILQESLTNVARHSKADKVNVKLGQTNGKVVLEVHDNGRGINAYKLKNEQSLGILGMKERASLWDGTMEIMGKKNEGTTVYVEIPIETKKEIPGS
tara:strand:- start:22136 stop:25192 length:3057 start_codon:yes stop_codon:yes gene_type:complete